MNKFSALVLALYPVFLWWFGPLAVEFRLKRWESGTLLHYEEKDVIIAASIFALSCLGTMRFLTKGRKYFINEMESWKWEPSELHSLIYSLFSPINLIMLFFDDGNGKIFCAMHAYTVIILIERFRERETIQKKCFDESYAQEVRSHERQFQVRLQHELAHYQQQSR